MTSSPAHDSTPDPEDNAKALATGAIDAAGKSLFGGVVGSVVSDDVLGLFGLGSSDGVTSYLQQINSKLDALSAQITQLQSSIDAISATETQILNDLAALQNQLSQGITDIELQSALQQFSLLANVIKENFASYVNAVTAMAGQDPGLRTQGGQDLFALFGLANLQQIAVTAADMQQLFAPDLSSVKSIPALLLSRTATVLTAWGAAPGSKVPGRDMGKVGTFAFGPDVLAAVIAGTSTQLAPVASVFRSFAVMQVEALILITTAWIGSAQENQVATAATAMKKALQSLPAFSDALLQGHDDWPGLPTFTTQQIPIRGGEPFFQDPSNTYVIHHEGETTEDVSRWPYDSSWIAWNLLTSNVDDGIRMVHQPLGPPGSPDAGATTLLTWDDEMAYISFYAGAAPPFEVMTLQVPDCLQFAEAFRSDQKP